MGAAECYIVGIDYINDPDMATLAVVRRYGDNLETIHTYTGEEAREKYEVFMREFGRVPGQSRT